MISGNAYLDTLSKTANGSTAGGVKAKGSDTLDQNSFLKLMTTQMKTQDPFNPVDNTQMVAQMAQFSSVAGIAEMNTSLKTMAADIKAARAGDAADWIGRSALVAADIATPLSDGGYAGQITLPENATALSIALVDQNGATVHSETVGATDKGTLNWAWDGKAADGAGVAADGPLKLVVTASKARGFMSGVTNATWTKIAGVQSPADGAATRLVTGLGLIAPSDAQRLS